jgi:hypothetical protein
VCECGVDNAKSAPAPLLVALLVQGSPDAPQDALMLALSDAERAGGAGAQVASRCFFAALGAAAMENSFASERAQLSVWLRNAPPQRQHNAFLWL